MSSPAVFGIDLGTTNSVISWLVNGTPQAIPVDGNPIVPSVVGLHDDQVVVGRVARNLELEYPERTVSSVKRKMGLTQELMLGNRPMQPENISAEILLALKRGAEKATQVAVRDVVITVPAYFDDGQRRATLRAGELAGLNVLRLLNEPTSASLVYEQTQAVASANTVSEYMLVYDLGGGTFDVSVLEIADSIREVRSTAGNSHLGGDDFDQLLLRQFIDDLKARGISVAEQPRAVARLRRLAEQTKIQLSTALEVMASQEFLTEHNGQPVHFQKKVTRREFEEWVRPLLMSTIDLCRKAIADAKLDSKELRRACLVGGSTRIPLVRELLESELGVSVHEEVDVDLAVGQGASIQAGLLTGCPVGRILVDVAAHSLGVKALGEYDDGRDVNTYVAIVHRNTALPVKRVKEFFTMVDNQQKVAVEVFQGEEPRCSQNAVVGEFSYSLAPSPALTPVAIEFEYDLNGIVKVTVQQAGGEAKSVALSVHRGSVNAIASDIAGSPKPASDSPLVRKVDALVAKGTLDAETVRQLEGWKADLHAPESATRESAEEALLDFLLEHEG